MAAGHVDVEFLPGPGLFVALAVFLAADVAGGGQVGEHLAEVLRDLPLETRRLRPRTLFALAWTSALARRRGIIERLGIVFAVVGRVLDRLLARFDLGGVARDRPDDVSPSDARSARRGSCLAARRARIRRTRGKTWLRKELASVAPSRGCGAGTCRRRGARSGRWWWERPGPPWPRKLARGRDGPRAGGRPPGRLGNEGFEADHVERSDETTQRFGDRVDILTHRREQKALDVAPASLHRVERVVCHVYS